MTVDNDIIGNKVIQIILSTPDGRIVLLKNTDSTWDMTLRTLWKVQIAKEAVSRTVQWHFSTKVDQKSIAFVSSFKPAAINMHGEIWAAELLSNESVIITKESKRSIIAVPFEDILRSVVINPDKFTYNTKKACTILEAMYYNKKNGQLKKVDNNYV